MRRKVGKHEILISTKGRERERECERAESIKNNYHAI